MNNSTTDTLVKHNRSLAIDFLKAIAIFGVVVIHTCSYNYDIASFNWTASVFWGSAVRASVPIFFMCSGALLLSQEYILSPKKFFSKNVLRIIISMLFWAMAYKVFHLLAGHTLSFANIFQAVKEVLLFKQEAHLYFLQIILLVYLFLPVTRIITQYATKRQIEYLLALWFVFGIVFPTVVSFWPFNLLSGIPMQYKINETYAAIGYGLLGYYLKQFTPWKKVPYIIMTVGGFLITFGGTYISSVIKSAFDTQFLEGMSVGVCLMAAGIFGLCLSIRIPSKSKIGAKIIYLSKASFCVYLTHMFFLLILSHFGISAAFLPTIISTPIVAGIIFICSLFAYAVLSRIPFVKKWLI